MSWLHRPRATPGSIGAGDPSPPRGDPGPCSHDSPALSEIFGAIDPERPVRLLDLGPALPTNLEFYDGLTNGIRIAHLLRDLEPYDPDEPTDETFVSTLDRLAPSDNETFELILIWNTLDYLNAPRSALLCHHLAAVAAHGAHLHAMTLTTGTMPVKPSAFEIAGPGRLIYRSESDQRIDAPDTPPAVIERRLDPFRVKRSVLLRHGVREFIGVID